MLWRRATRSAGDRMISSRVLASIQRQIWRLLMLAGVQSPPLSAHRLSRICALQRVTVMDSAGLLGLHGALSVNGRGLVIRVNPALSLEERRFTIAHEIGHTIIDHDVPVLRSWLAARINRPLQLSEARRERLCDWIASEILVPSPAFRAEAEMAPQPDLLSDRLADFGVPEHLIHAHPQSERMRQFRFLI